MTTESQTAQTTTHTASAQALALASTRNDLGLLALRLITGLVFFMHGYQKFFQYGLSGVTDSFTKMGAPLPGLTAPLVSGIELIGGLLLILGLFTRWAAAAVSVSILGAILIVHLKGGFFAPNGVEFPLTLLGAGIALALLGGGRYGLDRR